MRPLLCLACAAGVVPVLTGCRAAQRQDAPPTVQARTQPRQTRESGHFNRPSSDATVRAVRCVFDQRPWLNLDAAGDRDPEGIRFRVYLVSDSGKGVFADGMLHVEMYAIERQPEADVKRTLFSDWHYPMADVHRIDKPGMLGEGYFPHLLWKSKGIAGREVEIITSYEAPNGNLIRSATKRLRIPKYST